MLIKYQLRKKKAEERKKSNCIIVDIQGRGPALADHGAEYPS